MVGGYNLISDIGMVDLVRVKSHKKKRINKKWFKRYGMKAIPKKYVYVIGNTIMAHPSIVRAIEMEIDQRNVKSSGLFWPN